ncbi:MAG: gamma subclass chorismate mutase AroQ [Endozoicomonadaceae bacterium]|nr:gamma subclass chorismate mutase AroQ [Endozoicomonadaceae bacterium]
MKHHATLPFDSPVMTSQVRPHSKASAIFRLINKRLSYMEDIALFKKQTGIPVEDLLREKIVIKKAMLKARDEQLDQDSIASFFQVQINAVKSIQYCYLADWLSHPVNQQPRDLYNTVRPALLELGNEIITEIGQYLKSGNSFSDGQLKNFIAIVDVKNLRNDDRYRLFEKLQEIRQTH